MNDVILKPLQAAYPEIGLSLGCRDFRPRCALLIGDGFFRGAMEYYGVLNRVITSPLMPLPASVRYLPANYHPAPHKQDKFSEGPIWREELFPDLWKHWHEYVGPHESPDSWWLFCQELAKDIPFSLNKSEEKISFCNQTVGIQLRAYLWNVFRFYDQVWREAAAQKPADDYAWWPVLKWLVNAFQTTMISFNYDCVLEGLVELAGKIPIVPTSRCVEHLNTVTSESVTVLKPHGSISIFTGAFGPNPWLGGTIRMHNCSFNRQVRYPPNQCPALPDLVPPGHSQRHLAAFDTDVHAATSKAISGAEVLILCGLSARAPDTEEIESYLKSLARMRS